MQQNTKTLIISPFCRISQCIGSKWSLWLWLDWFRIRFWKSYRPKSLVQHQPLQYGEAKNIYEILCYNFWRWRKSWSVEKNVWKYWRDDQTNFAFNLPLCQRQGKLFDSTGMWPTEAMFYRSAWTEQNMSIKILFPEPKPNRTEHVKSA